MLINSLPLLKEAAKIKFATPDDDGFVVVDPSNNLESEYVKVDVPTTSKGGNNEVSSGMNESSGCCQIDQPAYQIKTLSNPYNKGNVSKEVTKGQGSISDVNEGGGFGQEKDNLLDKTKGTSFSIGGSIDLTSFKAKVRERGAIGVKYHVSHPFTNPVDGSVHYMIVIQLPQALWYLRGDFFNIMFDMVYKDISHEWMKSFMVFNIRRSPYGPDELSRRTKPDGSLGYAKQMIAYTLSLSKSAASISAKSITDSFCKIEMIFTRISNVADAYFSWMSMNSPGLIVHFEKKQKDHGKIIEMIKKDFNSIFGKGRSTYYQTPLDKYFLDWDIKQFLQNKLGLNDWPEDHLNQVFARYPNKPPPNFNKIQELKLTEY